MNFLDQLDQVSNRLEKAFLAGAIIISSLLLFVNVVMRYVFLLPIYWAEEFVRYLMVWLIFIGASQVTRWGGHVAVDIVPRVLSKRGNIILAFAVNLICIFFCIVLAYLSLKQMLRVKGAGQISPALEIPMWIAYLSIPAGTILMLIRFLQQFWARIQGKSLEIREVLD
jgi:C4-dicarboxylate transporter, DctQ subunit